ncbi:hypothetical protein [Streptomyces javensis]
MSPTVIRRNGTVRHAALRPAPASPSAVRRGATMSDTAAHRNATAVRHAALR